MNFAISCALLLAITSGAVLLFYFRHSITELTALSLRKMPVWERSVLVLGGIALFACAWSFAHWMRPTGITRIPSPAATMGEAYEMLASGVLYNEAKISLFRIFVGFGLAFAAGTLGGVFAGSFSVIHRLTVPVNSFLRYIPPTAFVSLMIVYFGIGEKYKYAVVFVGVIFLSFR